MKTKICPFGTIFLKLFLFLSSSSTRKRTVYHVIKPSTHTHLWNASGKKKNPISSPSRKKIKYNVFPFYFSLFLSMNRIKNRFSLVTTVFRSKYPIIQIPFSRECLIHRQVKKQQRRISCAINEALRQRGIIISTLLSKE